jgi:hypothetical protein
MNVAKNKKPTFYNLIELIHSLSEEERNKFTILANKKREHPKYIQFFNKINNLVQDGQTFETIDVKGFKIEIELNLTDNFNKLSENLYTNILSFIADQYKLIEWKSWHIEAENYLLEIESLIARELYSQAAAHILKLEAKIKNHDDEQKIRIYNDRYIYSRLANSKIQIAVFNEALYSIDETDKMFHNLFQMGDYFYSSFYSNSSIWSLNKHKAIGYELLAKYLIEKEKYDAAHKLIQKNILNLKVANNIENEDKIMLLNYYNLYEAFLKAKNGDNNDLYHYSIKESYENFRLPQVVLLEQQINEIQLALSLKNNETDIVASLDAYGLVQYSEKKIASISTRKEINNSINHYLSRDYAKSLEIVLSLKPQNKDKKSFIYLNLLFLELLVRLQSGDYDYKSITRSIKSIVDANQDLYFEQKAIRLIEKWAELSLFGRKNFPIDNSDELNLLQESSKEIEVIHNLILFTLKGKA